MELDKDILYLEHILDHTSALHKYIAGVTEDDFFANQEKMDACLMRLISIGENISKLSRGLESANSSIDWQAVKAARNVCPYV